MAKMIFKGDLSKYHPADAMMFLSQAGSDGVLSIADQDCLIALTFKGGKILDAQSGTASSCAACTMTVASMTPRSVKSNKFRGKPVFRCARF